MSQQPYKPNSMDRRAFLHVAGTGSAFLPAFSFVQRATEEVRVGFIGVGNRGTYLLKGILEMPGVRVTALCDIKPDRLDRAATLAARDHPKTFTDYRELLEQADIDAVFIATPCDLHVEMAIAALRAGKHVYLEKPVGITAESIQLLLDEARKAKPLLYVGQQRRSSERLRKTIEIIHEGIAGEPIMIKAQRHTWRDLDHHGPSADWFFFVERSGDVIVEMAVHNLDVCNWVANSIPAYACGFGGTLLWKDDPPGRTNMDGYTLSYEYANGIKMCFTQVFFHPREMPGNGQYTFVYTKEGAIHLEEATFYPREGGERKVLVPEIQEDPWAHQRKFFECIRTGQKPPADIRVGAIAALTAILGREAIYQRRVISWRDLGVDI